MKVHVKDRCELQVWQHNSAYLDLMPGTACRARAGTHSLLHSLQGSRTQAWFRK
jgi:hypothetical protein